VDVLVERVEADRGDLAMEMSEAFPFFWKSVGRISGVRAY
jgi:hypothetical protein